MKDELETEHSTSTEGSRSSESTDTTARRHPTGRRATVAAIAVCTILTITVAIARRFGVPVPQTWVGRSVLDNPVCYIVAKWFGIRVQGQVLRAFTDASGNRGYKLISAVFSDNEGKEVSRVVNGNGVALYYHPNGCLAKFEMFRNGMNYGPYYILWAEDGHVKNIGFIEHNTGYRVSWGFSSNGHLVYEEKQDPRGNVLLLRN